MDKLIYEIEEIVRKCGTQILSVNQEKIKTENKEGIGNIVTQYDKLIQKELKNKLLKLLPDANFIGEEDNCGSVITNKRYNYIVDPIDGTTNFYRGISLSAISVGLIKNGELYMGVCYNPYIDEMFIAQKGKGAYLNRKPIKVSNKKLDEGIVLAGNAPYYKEKRKKSLEILNDFANIALDYRRFGSAVIALCNIACGRAEVYYELKLQPWDYAAAMLIVEEAGGKVTQINKEEIQIGKPTSIIASNNKEDYFKYINIEDLE